jgi:hypothetical protein
LTVPLLSQTYKLKISSAIDIVIGSRILLEAA